MLNLRRIEVRGARRADNPLRRPPLSRHRVLANNDREPQLIRNTIRVLVQVRRILRHLTLRGIRQHLIPLRLRIHSLAPQANTLPVG